MAKKSASSKKSPKPAAKKAPKQTAAKRKAAAKAAQPPASAVVTEDDWAQIYAKAWLDEAFRTLLETDPTAALKQFAAEHGRKWTKLVRVPEPPGAPAAATLAEGEDENCIHLVSCC